MIKYLFKLSKPKRAQDLLLLLLNKSILFAFPFILIPLIIKNIGLYSYGQYVTAQSAGMFFSSFISFGFEVYGITEIAKLNSYDKPNYISRLFSLQTSLLLTICGLLSFLYAILKVDIILFILLSTVIGSREILYTPIIHIAESKSIFVGIKNSLERIILLCFLFLLPFKIDIGNILLMHAGIVLIIGMINYYWLRIKLVWDLNFINNAIIENNQLILSKIIASIKDRVSIFLIGISFGFSEVAYLDIGQKFINLISFPTSAINQFGLAERNENRNYLIKLFTLSIGSSLLLSIPLILLSELIPIYFDLDKSYFKSMIVFIIIGALSLSGGSILGINGLLSNNLNKAYLRGMIYTVLFYFILLMTESLFDIIPSYLLIIIPSSTYLFEFIIRIYFLKINTTQ